MQSLILVVYEWISSAIRPSSEVVKEGRFLKKIKNLQRHSVGVFLFGAIPDALTAGVRDQDADSLGSYLMNSMLFLNSDIR